MPLQLNPAPQDRPSGAGECDGKLRQEGFAMSISGISSGSSDVQSLFHQRRADFKAMEAAVKSSDMTSANSALTAYQKGVQNIQTQFGQKSPFSSNRGGSKFQSDLLNLTSAIQSGSRSDAQGALTTLQQDRHGTAGSTAQANGSTTAAASSASSFVQDLTKLVQDTQAGNTSADQADQASLIKVFQALMNGSNSVSGASGHHYHHHGGGVSAANGAN
jgi:hypothetical protein